MSQHENGSAGADGKPKKKASRIDWTNPTDVMAVAIASMGYSNKCVQHYCGLTDGQIYYRLRKANSTKARQAFRDGTSSDAKQVMRRELEFIEGRVERTLAKEHQTDSKKRLPPGG